MLYLTHPAMNTSTRRRVVRHLFISIACFFSLLLPIMVHADGYDLPITQWPVDSREYISGFFWSAIDEANYVNNQPDTFIYGWLGVFTAPPNGIPGSGRFTQIGIMSSNGQLFWVMESERKVTQCLRGSQYFVTNGPLTGCMGVVGDVMNPNHEFNAVSIVHDDPSHQWVVNVLDFYGNQGVVAAVDDGTIDGYYPGVTIYSSASSCRALLGKFILRQSVQPNVVLFLCSAL